MCEYCEGLNKERKDIAKGNRLHVCIRRNNRLHISYATDDTMETPKFGRRLKINYCPMCGKELKSNIQEEN